MFWRKRHKVVPLVFPIKSDKYLDKECSICLEELKNENYVTLPCLHNFHSGCILSWFDKQIKPDCPHCRKKFIYILTDKKNDILK